MAELVALIASIASLIQITGQVGIASHGYIGAVKEADKDIDNLCQELTALGNVLAKLEQQASATNSQASALSELDTPLQRCIAEMKDLQSKLKPKSGLRKVFRRLKWPLKEKETAQAISQIERHKSLFNLALTADQLFLSKAIEVFSRNTNMAVDDLVQSIQNEFAAQRLQRQQDDASRAGKKRMEVLNWLFSGQFDQKHTEISGKRQEHTGKWLSQEPQYQAWVKDNPDFKLLWGHGIPGAGKTFLSSLVIDQLESRALMTKSGVAHIYFNYKEQDQQTPVYVVSSLIKQLAVQIPNLPKEIEALYDQHSSKQKRPTLEELKQSLLVTLKHFTRVFFVFDALDECHEDTQRKDLLPFFHILGNHGASIFMTSRPYPRDIHESVSTNGVAKIELKAKEEDIRVYVEEKIKGNAQARALIREGFRDEIVAALVKCCRGMFLLVHFHIEDLCQYTTVRQVQTALKELNASLRAESSLNGIYSRAMEKVRSQHKSRAQLALNVLSWLVKARRTLTVDEIRVAVSVEESTCDLSEGDMPETAMLIEVCVGLAIIDDKSNTIQLAHYSVQEYLVGNSVIPESADLQLAIVCMTLLSNTSDPPDTSASSYTSAWSYTSYLSYTFGQASHHPVLSRFRHYAVVNVYPHLQACDEDLSAEAYFKFLDNRHALISYVHDREYRGGWASTKLLEVSRLHEASLLGHRMVVCDLINRGADVSLKDTNERTALNIAAHEGHEAVVRLLLEKGADPSVPDSYGRTPLYAAAEGGHEAVVHLLLEKGADPSVTMWDWDTPLHAAAAGGYEAVVQALLDKGADPSVSVWDWDIPLHAAAAGGHEAVVQALLKKGADPSVPSRNGDTPLHAAASRGHEAVVQLLLEKGADPSVPGWNRDTPLYAAASRGHEAVVQVLLEKCADPSVPGGYGRTPLYAAAGGGHGAVVQLLLDKGADPSVPNRYGVAPLYAAAAGGHEAVIQLLLDKSVDISAISNNRMTAISMARTPEIINLLSKPQILASAL